MKKVLIRFKMTKKVIVTLVMLAISAAHSNAFGSDIIDDELKAKKTMVWMAEFLLAAEKLNDFGPNIDYDDLETKQKIAAEVLRRTYGLSCLYAKHSGVIYSVYSPDRSNLNSHLEEVSQVVPQMARRMICFMRTNTLKALKEGLEEMDKKDLENTNPHTDHFFPYISCCLRIAIGEIENLQNRLEGGREHR